MKRFFFFCLSFFTSILGYTQNAKKTNVIDTNMIVYDEQGNALRYYQYKKFFNSGWYGIRRDGPADNPATKRYLRKLSQEEHDKRVESAKKVQTLNSPILKENMQLDLEPLADEVSAELTKNKVIVLVFWVPHFQRSPEIFAGMNDFFKNLKNPDDVSILLITRDSWSLAKSRLKDTPLLNAKIISDAQPIITSYGVRTPAWVVADKNMVIRHAVSGFTDTMVEALKKTITTVLAE
ncbi:hypothetical protein ABIE26_001575 [Pedobacter africanus]|uniref:Uncharacterized protein n=1 Tax=Pedobacter africanus TaxID=151894 RepID=A0ACC6KS60_9SPHI|nr:hypothetical protein [Pedobacter africanus]MDR6781936.1 hypothetical protein [Pedobacter africanus]